LPPLTHTNRLIFFGESWRLLCTNRTKHRHYVQIFILFIASGVYMFPSWLCFTGVIFITFAFHARKIYGTWIVNQDNYSLQRNPHTGITNQT